jgi:phage FluMu gp28-like protein
MATPRPRPARKAPPPTPRLAAGDPLQRLETGAADRAAPPPALMSYQQAWVKDESPFKLGEKGRRVGLTWAEASDDVLIASSENGSNVFYIGPTKDMAIEYIEACAMWARVFHHAATEIEDGIFEDIDDQGNTKNIQSFTIRFPGSRKRIVALSSPPTNLRGKQGVIVIDEAAYANLKALLKAAMAMVIWGDRVRVLSSHNGADNPFNDLIQEVRAGKRKGTVHRITFDKAVAAGLYKRVCLRRGLTWTAQGEKEWVADVRAYYGDDAEEELDVVPSQSGGAFLTLALIEARMFAETPIVRVRWTTEFGLKPEHERYAEVAQWCEEELAPHLKELDIRLPHYFGEDFGRVSDLTVIDVAEEGDDLVKRVRLHVELSNCPFRQQEQILFFIVDRLPRFRAGDMDATGNGAALAEYAQDRYGASRIQAVKLSPQIYLEHMPRFKAALEDGTLTNIPRDRQVRDDLRALRVVHGIAQLPKAKTQVADGEKLSRHGDSAIALFMLHRAMTRGGSPIEFQALGMSRVGIGIDEGAIPHRLLEEVGFGAVAGGNDFQGWT